MTVQEMQEQKIELGYTNAMLAEKSGVPLSTVQKVLGGFTRAPRKATLRALENALRKDPDVSDTESLRESFAPYAPGGLGAQSGLQALREKYQRAELIDGQLCPLPSPSPIHQEIIVRALVRLADHLASARDPGKILPSPFGVWLGDEGGRDYFEPDLMVIRDPKQLSGAGCTGAPDWVLEVASPATKYRDYTVKPCKYRSAGVKECWIADPGAGIVITYWFGGEEEEMRVFALAGEVPSRLFSGLTVKLGEERQ